jgi:cytochrome c biogenesis protein CcmG, thiol:disulfide interchange protein DsbE
MRRLIVVIPVLILVSLFALFAMMIMRGDKQPATSRLVGQSAPQFVLDSLLDETKISLENYRGQPVVVNFFASWCTPCRAEHPILMNMKAKGITLIGINYKNRPDDARAFLEELGNPFSAIGKDESGRTGINFGITGVPESFVIGPNGMILANWAGPLDERIVEKKIMPALQKASMIPVTAKD